MKTDSPTQEQFTAYELMFTHFNKVLFDYKLPAVFLNFSRKTKTNGFFAPQRWNKADAIKHEISLNPTTLHERKPIAVASTLVHEMCHLWQQEFGKPSRSGYHNQEWAARMESVGLIPSDTGEPNGKRCGQRVTHYILEGGVFEHAFKELPKAALLPWTCGSDPVKQKKATEKNKIKYTCAGCECNVWGKPDLNIVCDDCDTHYYMQVE